MPAWLDLLPEIYLILQTIELVKNGHRGSAQSSGVVPLPGVRTGSKHAFLKPHQFDYSESPLLLPYRDSCIPPPWYILKHRTYFLRKSLFSYLAHPLPSIASSCSPRGLYFKTCKLNTLGKNDRNKNVFLDYNLVVLTYSIFCLVIATGVSPVFSFSPQISSHPGFFLSTFLRTF